VVGQGLRDEQAGLINWAEADLEERGGFISYHVVVDGGVRVEADGEERERGNKDAVMRL
jgi:hypothetical protein